MKRLVALFAFTALVYGQIETMPMRRHVPRQPGNDPNSPNGQPGQPEPPVTGKGSISGVVINAKTHEPVKKANVMINGNASLSAVTDAGGNFSFRALPQGVFWVMANHPDFTGAPQRGQMAVNVALGEGDEKTGVELRLQPGASIAGRVIDEDDRPIASCSVSAMKLDSRQARPGMSSTNGASTDGEGVYRIHGVAAGRYVVRAQCNQSFPAAHGFMRPNDPDIPTEGYAPLTYGGGASAGTGGLMVEAGADLNGIDFRLRRARMFSVRTLVSGADPSMLPALQLFLVSKDNRQDDEIGMPAQFNGRRGQFVFRNVPAGSYEMTATVFNGEKGYDARQDVQVGASQVTEVELRLAPAPNISGTVESDDPNVQVEGQQISMQPLTPNYRGAFPAATIAKDGTFEFKVVLPGRFSLNGLQGGFYKSVTLGGREVTPSDFEIPAEGSGSMRISLSSRFGKVQVNSESPSKPGEQMAAALFPATGGQPIVNFFAGNGPVEVQFDSVPPGKYRVLLISSENPWVVVNDATAQKALEDRMAQVTVAEGGEQRVTAVLVGKEELAKLLESTE